MNYLISEAEFHSLISVRQQISLIACLLCDSGKDMHLVAQQDLMAFMDAQVSCLQALERSLEERFELSKGMEGMEALDWIYALRTARGDANHMPQGTITKITAKLSQVAQLGADDMDKALAEEWRQTLRGLGQSIAADAADQTKAKQRKRDRLAARVTP